MHLEFEDIPLMIAGKPFGRFDGQAEIDFGDYPHDGPEVTSLWLYSDTRRGGRLKRQLVPVREMFLTEGQRSALQMMILSDYADQIDEARREYFANWDDGIEPGRLLQSEMR